MFLQPIVDKDSYALQKDGSHGRETNVTLTPTMLDGSFAIANVPVGKYYVIAEQEGYISPVSVFTREQLNHPDGATLTRIAALMTAISVSAGHTTQTEVHLLRGGAISGNVHFDDGAPAIHTEMKLLRRNTDGKWAETRISTVANSFGGFNTDDRGMYRIGGLPEGEYLVRANVSLHAVASDHVFAGQGGTAWLDKGAFDLDFFPGDTFRSKDAKPLKVSEGSEATQVDIDIPVSALYTVSGTVLQGGTAHMVNGADLELVYADDETKLAATKVGEDGQFHFLFVPAGQFLLKATKVHEVERTEVPTCDQCMPPTRTEEKVLRGYADGKQPVLVQSDLTGVTVNVQPAAATK